MEGRASVRAESLLLVGPRRLAWVAEDLPPPGPDEVMVQTIAGAISIGTELPLYRGDSRRSTPPRYPCMTGYENLGRVLAVGPQVGEVRTGDRVLAFYGHRTCALVPAAKTIPVPAEIPDTLALTAILSCDAAKGVRGLGLTGQERVLVTGAGAMGLLAVFVLRAFGIRHISVVEPDKARGTLALRLGARDWYWPAPPDAAYDAGIECSARDAAFALLQERVRPGGCICVLSDGNVEPLTLAPAFHANELRIIASSDGEDYRGHARWYFAHSRRYEDTPALLFQHEISHTALPATFARLATGVIAPVKVLIRYGEAGSGEPRAQGTREMVPSPYGAGTSKTVRHDGSAGSARKMV